MHAKVTAGKCHQYKTENEKELQSFCNVASNDGPDE